MYTLVNGPHVWTFGNHMVTMNVMWNVSECGEVRANVVPETRDHVERDGVLYLVSDVQEAPFLLFSTTLQMMPSV